MKTLIDVAKTLAEFHKKEDRKTTDVLLSPDPGGSEIRLIEVSESAPTTNEVIPFRFSADPKSGIDYPSVVILLSPSEWKAVLAGALALPTGWDYQNTVSL